MNAHLGYLGDQHAQRLVPAETIVRLEKASKTFPGRDGQPVTALQDIDLTVPQGSILGVIGRSGAGKSTLIRLVNGLSISFKERIKAWERLVTQLQTQQTTAANAATQVAASSDSVATCVEW